ncbi:histone H2A [Enteropsectra breve]|nr:histone H2A [Enteropsectra breve]
MSGGKGGKRDPKKEKNEDKSATTFKPAHIKRIVKKLTKMRVSRDTLKACSAAVTYIMLEILDGGKNSCQNEGKKKMSPKHINGAIVSDVELTSLLKNYVIQSGGSRQFSLPEITRKN